MPMYEEECTKCGYSFEYYSPHFTSDTKPCPKCIGEALRVFSRYAPKIFAQFVTRNILPDGSPVVVKSQSQLSSLCNEHKLVHLDDPKYEPKHMKPKSAAEILGVNPNPEGERGVEGGAIRREDIA